MQRNIATASRRNRGGNNNSNQDKPPRNRRPCRRCAGSQVRCNVQPPYSEGFCERCTREGRPCPPFQPRRGTSTSQTASNAAANGMAVQPMHGLPFYVDDLQADMQFNGYPMPMPIPHDHEYMTEQQLEALMLTYYANAGQQ